MNDWQFLLGDLLAAVFAIFLWRRLIPNYALGVLLALMGLFCGGIIILLTMELGADDLLIKVVVCGINIAIPLLLLGVQKIKRKLA